MKQTNDKNQIWFEKQDQVVNIGFTKSFLDTLDQCWHILPATMERFREKSPLLTIETDDSLVSILSPVNGSFLNFTAKAQNFPNKLTENDVVLSVTEGKVARPVEPPQFALNPARVLFNDPLMDNQQAPEVWPGVAPQAGGNADMAPTGLRRGPMPREGVFDRAQREALRREQERLRQMMLQDLGGAEAETF